MHIRTYNDDCRQLMPHLDANETVFFARQLEFIKPQTYDVLYAELSAFNLFPINTSAGPGAKSITYRSFDSIGDARIIGTGGADDLPTVSADAKEVTTGVVSIGANYRWTLQDIRSAMMANVSLDARLARSAVRAHNQKINDLAWNGSSVYNIPGLASNSDIHQAATTSSTVWASATADQMIADVTEAYVTMQSTTKGVHVPDTCAMPPQYIAAMMAKPRATTSDTSVRTWLENALKINFVPAVELVDFHSTNDAFMLYKRDPDILTLEIPQGYEELPVQMKNLSFEVPTHSRCGGLIVYYPKAIEIRYGLD